MLISGSKDKAKGYIKAMKLVLEQNPKLHEHYGKILQPPGSTFEFNLKARRIRKEPSIMAAGIGTDIVGHHGDLLCMDDVIQDDKPRDLNVRLKKQDWADETLEGCVDPNTKVWWIGTRKSPEDIYQYIMNKPGTTVILQPAIYYEQCASCGNDLSGHMWNPETEMFMCTHCGVFQKAAEVRQKTLCPEHRPYLWLVKKRAKMGSFKFSREMQNKPVSEEGGLLKREWLKEYARLPFPKSVGAFYCGVDPAIGEKTQADYTVIVTIAKYENRIYVVDCARGRWNFVQTKEHLQKVWHQQAPLQVGVEANFYQRALTQDIINQSMMPVVEVRYHRDKVERIMSTVGYYAEVGKLILNRSLPFKEAFLGEYLDFPDGEHEDILDALATAIEVATKPVGAILYVK
jgi:predicted phage terminase large subunit-like protein